MSSNSDATPAYRGYRLQALYALSRILNQNPDDNLIFQPEGNEDLAVFDSENNLLEIVQVKERTQDLSLSSFKPDKDDSFFYRIAKEISDRPDINIVIVAFGNVGQEIREAIEKEGSKRNNVVKKLANYKKISEDESSMLFEKITLTQIDENELTNSVFSILQSSLAGIDPEISFGLLMYWLFICSEEKTKITRTELIEKINKIGSFLSSRTAHHQQWFTTITPLEDSSIEIADRIELEDEFYKGISTRYDHILANADVLREEKMREIHKGFSKKRIVIIHAASGQGKTTPAYRYLHEYFPQEWRFRIQAIFNREHALNIALALASHSEAIGVPMIVYIDVSPQDRDWAELVKQLATHKNIRVLVTIREEDWRRTNISNSDFDFQNIELNLDSNEAEKIYNSLATKKTPVNVLNFEDAWNKFNESGPLLEFIYLITQGSSLRDKLSQQIKFLENEVREGRLSDSELKLLRLVAVASEYEASLHLKSLIKYLNLSQPKSTLNLFEKEYLLRVSKDKELVSGLHPIRSSMLSELLSDPTFSPWSETAGECLEFIQEKDLEIFLLYSFSRHTDEIEKLLPPLFAYQPKGWLAISGCIRALIWLGLSKYIKANQNIIQEAAKELGTGLWSYFLDFDIAEAIPGVGRTWWEGLEDFFSEERIKKIEDFQLRQTDKTDVFILVKEWLNNRTLKPLTPETEVDWEALSETVFWLKKLDVTWELEQWISEILLTDVIAKFSIETLANIVYALSFDGRFDSWIENNKQSYIRRFREEMLVVALEEVGDKISAHYVFDFAKLNDANNSEENAKSAPKSENIFHWETMRRIDLMRRFFPDFEEFAIQGYGQMFWDGFLPHDDSIKTGIPKRILISEWATSVNSNFAGIGNLNFRPKTWFEYTEFMWGLRNTVVNQLEQLRDALQLYFSKNIYKDVKDKINLEEWNKCQNLLNSYPFLPISAVDEWGISSESTSSIDKIQRADSINRNILFLQTYKSYLKSFGEYVRTLANFFKQSFEGLILQPYVGRSQNFNTKLGFLKLADTIKIRNSPNLATLNFSDALKNLNQFQKDSRNILYRNNLG